MESAHAADHVVLPDFGTNLRQISMYDAIVVHITIVLQIRNGDMKPMITTQVQKGGNEAAWPPQATARPELPIIRTTGPASVEIVGLAGRMEVGMADQAMPAGPGVWASSRGAVGDVDCCVSRENFERAKGEEQI